VRFVILTRGLITRFIAGICAIFENDIKKIIALSTLRQLGIIILRLGLNLIKLALFHLITHAIFKAILFLCAGTTIHLTSNTQDIRHLRRLPRQLPSISSLTNISLLALGGLVFMAGIYSKEAILENSKNKSSTFMLIVFTFAI
jgi:NADH-ubiquinone oxidoreductase chain 5